MGPRSGLPAGAESKYSDSLSAGSDLGDDEIINDFVNMRDGPWWDWETENQAPSSQPSWPLVPVTGQYVIEDTYGPSTASVLPSVRSDEIAAAVNGNLHLPSAAIVAGLAIRWCVPPKGIPALEWAVDATVTTNRQASSHLIAAVNGFMTVDPSGNLSFPVVGDILNRSASRPQ